MDVAVHGVVHRCDVLGITRNWRICHDWIGIRRFINGFQLQSLVMNPQVRWFNILGIPFVFMRPIHRFASGTLPLKTTRKEGWLRLCG